MGSIQGTSVRGMPAPPYDESAGAQPGGYAKPGAAPTPGTGFAPAGVCTK